MAFATAHIFTRVRASFPGYAHTYWSVYRIAFLRDYTMFKIQFRVPCPKWSKCVPREVVLVRFSVAAAEAFPEIPRGHGELPQDDGGLPLLPQGHSGLPQDPFIASTTFRIGTCSGSGA